MKMVTAIIQPEKLADVKEALIATGVRKMTVVNVIGAGEQRGYTESYRGADVEITLIKKVQIEIAINEKFLQETVDAIIRGARTGKIGDGKIFISNLEECIRIRTGEKGHDAIG